MVSSMFSLRPGAKECSVPMTWKPDFSRTRVLGSESGHPDRLGISHLLEQCLEVGVRDRP
jgi:hypothetical protein